jgi:hypothetical protein
MQPFSGACKVVAPWGRADLRVLPPDYIISQSAVAPFEFRLLHILKRRDSVGFSNCRKPLPERGEA